MVPNWSSELSGEEKTKSCPSLPNSSPVPSARFDVLIDEIEPESELLESFAGKVGMSGSSIVTSDSCSTILIPKKNCLEKIFKKRSKKEKNLHFLI